MRSPHNATILFYKFTPVADTELLRLWQWELCRNLDLKGRILISSHGINGTLGGDRKALRMYANACKAYEPLGELDVKWDFVQEVPFPKLSVKARDEIVTFNFPELEVNDAGVIGGGTYLDADGLHELIASVATAHQKPVHEVIGHELLFLDARNDYEYSVGRFKGALNPGVVNAKEFVPFIESGAIDSFKDKPVVTYCTGGVRCEILTPILKAKGFTNVFQLDGGIVRYLQSSQNSQRLWEGRVYSFDQRITLLGNPDAVVGVCVHCGGATEEFYNCVSCNVHVLSCPACWDGSGGQCADCHPG